jgi:predicted dehydrogenase|tara:strand:- start:1222 stop:2160 length:939 start_codon:yes stop_codon:yes gene_type:complete
MKKKFNVLVVGFGYWGPILARNIQSNLHFNIYSICDSNLSNLNKAKNIYPNCIYFTSYKRALDNSNVDMVIISTPTNTHYKITQMALIKKKHVLCEKPLSLNLREVNHLISLSKKNKRFLFVDYPFIYSESVSFIKNIIVKKKLGKALIYESIREKAPYRKDTNVIWDLGIHDLSILQYLTNKNPTKFKVNTFKTKRKYKSDFANINLYYKNNFTAFIKLNWASPIKIRLVKIYFEKGLLIYDENEGIYKIKIYEKSKQGFNLQFPLVNFNETLKLFIDYVGNTLINGYFKNFNFNFSLNLTKTLLSITKNY